MNNEPHPNSEAAWRIEAIGCYLAHEIPFIPKASCAQRPKGLGLEERGIPDKICNAPNSNMVQDNCRYKLNQAFFAACTNSADSL